MITRLEHFGALTNGALDDLTVDDEIRVKLRQDLPEAEYTNPKLDGGTFGEFIGRYQQETGRQIKTSVRRDRWKRWYLSVVLAQESLFNADGRHNK